MRSVLPPAKKVPPAQVRRTNGAPPAGWPAPVWPNFHDWLPGDIIFVRQAEGSAKDAAIVAGQLSRFGPWHRASPYASVVHACLYYGSGEIVNMRMTEGLERLSAWHYVEGSPIEVMRLPDLDVERVVHRMETDLANKLTYSFRNILRDASGERELRMEEKAPDYCSAHVARVIALGDGRNLAQEPDNRPPWPAMLASHPDLVPVTLHWCAPSSWEGFDPTVNLPRRPRLGKRF